MELIQKPTLRQGVDAARSLDISKAVLMVGIPECDACKALKEDAPNITAGLSIDRVVLATFAATDGDELEAVQRLQMTDVPATYLFVDGALLGGWFGYDHNQPVDFRTGALRAVISAKLDAALAVQAQ